MVYFYLLLTISVGVFAVFLVIEGEKGSVVEKDDYNASDFEIIEVDA